MQPLQIDAFAEGLEKGRRESAHEIERLRAALKPFAAKVFNDNGDITYSGRATSTDYLRAYKALNGRE